MLGLFNLKIVFKDDYEKLVEDWEVQNKSIDTQAALINSQGKKISEYKRELEATEERIANMQASFEKEQEKLKNEYETAEARRRIAAGKNGGYVKHIHKLEDRIKELEIEKSQNEQCIRDIEEHSKQQEEQIQKLEKSNEFLKNNRRAPNIEELKDYQLRRKRNKKAS